ncbi:phosphate ABC transporter permease subunit PstC [Melioribacter sp. OK-6-Me]|uniref:phosphate ABC transporter permease subunit PstC n=1 Tax=unclassified Melioribacter TaxID=2627329 RepID=UPI003ED9AF42
MKFAKKSLKASRINPGDLIYEKLTLIFAIVVFLMVILMGYEMYINSKLSIDKFGWDFITETTWDPVEEIYGALPSIYGTLVSSFLALLMAVPLSLAVAIYLAESAPGWLEKPLSFMIELLAGVPSIVYGLWGIFVLVPWLREDVEPFLNENFGYLPFFDGPMYGFGMLAAAIILSIMVVPIITSISRDIMKSVPSIQKEAALALGATKWEAIKIVLKNSKSGILGAIMLGLGRAIGETMAVTMVIGNRPIISESLFDPGYTMASIIANEFTEATTELYLSALIELALILFVITIIINIAARLLVWSIEKQWKQY